MEPTREDHSPGDMSPGFGHPSTSDSGGGLIALAWLSCVIGTGYALGYLLVMAMSPTSRGPSVYGAIAISVWFMISAVAILIQFKRHRLGAAALSFIAIPCVVTVLGLLLALPGLMANPLAFLLILLIPATAAIFDLRPRLGRNPSWALEAVLAASLILTPTWILTHGGDFGETRRQLQQDWADHQKREAREKLFDSVTPLLKEALPKEVGTWHLTETMGPQDDSAAHSSFALEFVQHNGVVRAGIWALYKDSASQPDNPDPSADPSRRHMVMVESQLNGLYPELADLHDRKEFPGLTKDQANRLVVLQDELESLKDERYRDAEEWRQWDEHENVITVWIALRAPGDKVDEDIQAWKWPVEGTVSPQDLVVPWKTCTPDGRIDSPRLDGCVIGRTQKDGRINTFTRRLRSKESLPQFISPGMRLNVCGNDHGRTDQFVRALDLSGLVKLTEPPPAKASQTP